MLTNAVLQLGINVTKMLCAQIPKAPTSAVVKKGLRAMDFRVYVSNSEFIKLDIYVSHFCLVMCSCHLPSIVL